MENKENGFSYTYSASEMTDIKKIREKYEIKAEREESKLERLKRLDDGVTKKARIWAMTIGVIGTLIFGIGMSLVMSDFSQILGIYEKYAHIIGISVGVIGGIIAGVAYPVYKFTEKRERERITPEILRLTDELMK